MGAATQGCCREEPLGSGSGLLIPRPQPGSSPGTRLGTGTAACGSAGRPLCSPRPSSASVEEAPGRAGVGTAASSMLGTGDGSRSVSVSRKAVPTAWAGARHGHWPCHQHVQSLPDCSGWPGAAPAGSAARQPARHTGAKAQPWANPPAPTPLAAALAFPCGFPLLSCHEPVSGPPAAPIQLLRRSPAAGVRARSLPAPAARWQHQGHPTRWGRATTGAARGNNSQRQGPLAAPAQEQQLSHGGMGAAPALALGGQRWAGSGAAAPGKPPLGPWALSLRSTGRDSAGPSPPPGGQRSRRPADAHARSGHVTIPISPWHWDRWAATQPPLFREPQH